jgi:hypothetical protein
MTMHKAVMFFSLLRPNALGKSDLGNRPSSSVSSLHRVCIRHSQSSQVDPVTFLEV